MLITITFKIPCLYISILDFNVDSKTKKKGERKWTTQKFCINFRGYISTFIWTKITKMDNNKLGNKLHILHI